mgnify:CR=1 FL=1
MLGEKIDMSNGKINNNIGTIKIVGKIYSINVNRKKGVKKNQVKSAVINELGVEGDGHAGKWHRQVSLLSNESIIRFNEKGNISAKPGDFGENITTEGIDLKKLKIGDIILFSVDIRKKVIPENKLVNFKSVNKKAPRDSVILEVTQLGKECVKPCRIYYQVGSCIMPEEGIFCKVKKPGSIKVGNNIFIIEEIAD